MSDGWWRIKQHAPNAPSGFVVTEIPVRRTLEDDVWQNDPHWYTADWGLKLFHQDGREEYFPWASIVHAEYQPPTQETK